MITAPVQLMETPPPHLIVAAHSFGRARALALVAVFAGASGAGLHAQSNLLVAPDGQAYFATADGVYRIDARADHVEKLPITLNTTRLLIDTAGNLCGVHRRYDAAADLWRPAVWRYRSGEARIVASREATDAYAFAEVTDEDGTLYFREFDPRGGTSRLLVREKNYDVTLLAGHQAGARDGRGAAARLGRIGAMTLAHDRQLYFTDNGAVRRVGRDGLVTTLAHGGLLAAGAEGDDNPLTAIAVDEDRNIFVADRAHRRLLCIDAAGKVKLLADYEPDWEVAGLTVAHNDLFAVENAAADTRVRRLNASEPTGTILAYSADGRLLARPRTYSLEQRSILDSPLFRELGTQAASRKQLLDHKQLR